MADIVRPAIPGVSQHARRRMTAKQGIPFPFRLARVTFPHLKVNAMRHDIDGGFVYATETSKGPNGITFRSPKAMNGMMNFKGSGAVAMDGNAAVLSRNLRKQMAGTTAAPGDLGAVRKHTDAYVDQITQNFDMTYRTGESVRLGLTASDFISTTQKTGTNPDQNLQEAGTAQMEGIGDWDRIYNIVGDETSGGGETAGGQFNPDVNVHGSGLPNLPAMRNKAAKAELMQILPNVREAELNKEIVEVVRFKEMPRSRYKAAMDNGSQLETIMEDRNSRAATIKFERILKQRSVEILKTLANTFEVDENGAAAYTINATGEHVKFWDSYKGVDPEIELKKGMDLWKLAVFEWEPFVRLTDQRNLDQKNKLTNSTAFGNNVGTTANPNPSDMAAPFVYQWPEVFPDPTWTTSFLQSRLTDIRYTLPVAFMQNDVKVQNYWAWLPETADKVHSIVSGFHDAVQNRNLQKYEDRRIETFDILKGFTTGDAKLVSMLTTLQPIQYDIFTEFNPPSPNKLDTNMVEEINKKVLPIESTRDKEGNPDGKGFLLDVKSLRSAELKYLSSLPEVKALGVIDEDPAKRDTIWAYTVNTLGFPANRGVTGGGELSERFKVHTLTANYENIPIVAPAVTPIFKWVRNWINNRPIGDIADNDQAMKKFNDDFQDKFRTLSNVYLQHIFGQALHNALTEEMIGSEKTTGSVIIAYRVIAQKLLDSIAFAHNLGHLEAFHVFHVDVINRMIKLTQALSDSKTAAVLQQVAYAVCVEHGVAGLALSDKLQSYKTIKANVELLRRSASQKTFTARITAYPGFSGGAGWTEAAGYPSTKVTPTGDEVDKGITLWQHFDYWAMVLLDENYFKYHTYGTNTKSDTVQTSRDSRADILRNMTYGRAEQEKKADNNLQFTDVVQETGVTQETAADVNRRLGQRPVKRGPVPTRNNQNYLRDARKARLGQ